jgi:hypothetical protein
MKQNNVYQFIPVEELEHSVKFSQLVEQLRAEKGGGAYQPLRLVYAGDVLQEREFMEMCLVEDSQDQNKDFLYQDFLCMLHKLIRSKSN